MGSRDGALYQPLPPPPLPIPPAPQAVARRELRANALPASPSAAARRKKPAPVVSSTALTPGTEFMHDVGVSLGFFVAARAGQAKFRDVKFEVSGPTVAGEGEVKILGRLSRPWSHVQPGETHGACVFGRAARLRGRGRGVLGGTGRLSGAACWRLATLPWACGWQACHFELAARPEALLTPPAQQPCPPALLSVSCCPLPSPPASHPLSHGGGRR
jgi:hypothetical protein